VSGGNHGLKLGKMPGGASVSSCVAALGKGEAVCVPTDTVYGLAVMASSKTSPEPLYLIKGRAAEKAIPWLVASLDDLCRFSCDLPTWAWRLAERHWPGGLTLVVRAAAAVPPQFVAADGSLALRMPRHEQALQLIQALGAPLACTSANLSGEVPVTRAEYLSQALLARVGWVLLEHEEVGGSASLSAAANSPSVIVSQLPPAAPPLPSTIVSCLSDTPQILRLGALPVELLFED